MNPPLEAPEPKFDHLLAMTDERGTFEHALFGSPRTEHGYCTDDMARVLVVATREAGAAPAARALSLLSVTFLLDAVDAQGKCRNRMNRSGEWEDSRRSMIAGEEPSGGWAPLCLSARNL